MVFQFSLETLLRYRRSMERQQELKLHHAVQQMISSMKEIETVDQSIAAVRESEHQNLGQAIRAAQLHFDVLRRSVLHERRIELERVLVQQRNLHVQYQKEFQLAHRGREAVEILREEQMEHYQQKEAQREQKQMDDFFLLRREYLLRR